MKAIKYSKNVHKKYQYESSWGVLLIPIKVGGRLIIETFTSASRVWYF